jgi:hypothetical protein
VVLRAAGQTLADAARVRPCLDEEAQRQFAATPGTMWPAEIGHEAAPPVDPIPDQVAEAAALALAD